MKITVLKELCGVLPDLPQALVRFDRDCDVQSMIGKKFELVEVRPEIPNGAMWNGDHIVQACRKWRVVNSDSGCTEVQASGGVTPVWVFDAFRKAGLL